MQDDVQDPLIRLSTAARLLGSTGRGGSAKHPATLARWITRGRRLPDGSTIYLQAVRLGGPWVTKTSWLAEFVSKMTAAALPPADPAPRTPAERRRDSEAAAELKRRGV